MHYWFPRQLEVVLIGRAPRWAGPPTRSPPRDGWWKMVLRGHVSRRHSVRAQKGGVDCPRTMAKPPLWEQLGEASFFFYLPSFKNRK